MTLSQDDRRTAGILKMRPPLRKERSSTLRRHSAGAHSDIARFNPEEFGDLQEFMAAIRPLISRKPTHDPRDLTEPVGAYKEVEQQVKKLNGAYSKKDKDISLTPGEEALLNETQQAIRNQELGKKVIKRFRDVHFKAGSTAFDRYNMETKGSFHGFFALFWLALAFLAIKTVLQHYRETGNWFKGTIVLLYAVDIWDLAVVDAIMVCSSVFVYFLQKIGYKHLSWNRYGHFIEHAWQCLYLGLVVHRSYTGNWGWIQSVVIVLHCVVMLMKQYSYASYMGYLSEVCRTRDKLEKRLVNLRKSSETNPTLRVRRPSGDDASSDSTLNNESEQSEEEMLLAEVEELSEELTHGGVTYPENLTLWNYIDYLLVPSLVYDIVYPRTEKIRWSFVFEKTLATLGTFALMTMIVEHYILPVIPENLASMTTQEKFMELPWLMLDMVFPFITMYLLTFYIIFECVCQWFAEMTRFADRNFYNDWWNSLDWDAFSRDWNVPVHRFLLRHVYHSSMSAFNVKKQHATLITFVLSSLVHEMVMACMTKKIRAYLLLSQMLQLPLVIIMRTRFFKQFPTAANVFFWASLCTGPSMLCLAYVLF